MKPKMSNAEAITRINRFLAYLEEIWTPQCDCEEALIRRDDITAFVMARDALAENESLARSVNEASELLRKKKPHGEWTKESAIDYLTEIGWLPEHDRILTERPRKEGCCFADEECKNNPCEDCGLKEGE